jgi:hypothetical protein
LAGIKRQLNCINDVIVAYDRANVTLAIQSHRNGKTLDFHHGRLFASWDKIPVGEIGSILSQI